jgi:hypothetical protein
LIYVKLILLRESPYAQLGEIAGFGVATLASGRESTCALVLDKMLPACSVMQSTQPVTRSTVVVMVPQGAGAIKRAVGTAPSG